MPDAACLGQETATRAWRRHGVQASRGPSHVRRPVLVWPRVYSVQESPAPVATGDRVVNGVRPAPVTRARRAAKWRRALEGYLFAAPFLVGVVLFWIIPMLYSIVLVFMKWDLLTPPRFVGLANISMLFTDPLVPETLYNTAFYTFLGVPFHLVVALGLALLLNTSLRGVSIYRTLLYLPSVTPAVANAVIWLQLFHTDFGLLNSFLESMGMEGVRWLTSPPLAKPALILMTTWAIGPQIIIFLAGLQSVPEALHEAASIDGATRWQRFRAITLPMLSPTLFFNLVIGIIGSFQVFTAAYLITSGGPRNSTLFSVLYIYRNGFNYFNMGYASALAWMLFLIIMVFTLIQFRLARQWVYYEGEKREA
jgi:multiple sugar transport system permease protein